MILRAAGGTAPSASVLVNGAVPTGVANYLGKTTATTFPHTGLAASTQYSYTLVPYTYDGTNAATYNYYTTGAVTATGSSLADLTPALSVSPTSISFTSVTSGSTGNGTQVTPTAANFSGSGTVTVTAPAHFQVSNDNSSWNSSTTLSYSANTLTPATFWVRFAPGTAGAQGGSVTLSVDNNSATATVAVSGTAYAAAPTAQASSLVASVTANASGSVTLTWSPATFPGGATAGYVLAYGTTAPSFVASPNGLAPAAAVSSGTPVTLGNVTTATVSGLTAGTTYNFLLVPYTWDGSNSTTNNYLTASAPTASIMAVGTPSIATGIATVTSPGTATAAGSTIGAAFGTISQKGIVYAKATTSTNPTLTTNDGFTSEGAGTANFTSSLSGLSAQTLYYYRAYASNEAGTGYGTVSSFFTWAQAPDGAASGVSATANGASQVNLSWTQPTFPSAPNGYFIFRTAGADAVAFTATPGAAAIAGANTTLVGTVTAGGTTTYSNTTGLSPSTTYNYVVVPYTWDGTNAATYNYYATGYTVASATTGVATSATDYFRSRQTGAWSTADTWESSTDGSTGWMTATIAPGATAKGVNIQSPHVIAASGTITSQTITVASGATLNVSGTFNVANGVGTDLTVDGTLNNSGTMTLQGATGTVISSTGTWTNTGTLSFGTASTTLTINGVFAQNTGSTFTNSAGGTVTVNGTYKHGLNSSATTSAIPTATWNTGSTCMITGATSAFPSGTTQSFYNFTWDVPTGTGTIVVGANWPTNILGDMNILNVGTGGLLRMSSNTAYTVNVGGNLNFGANGGTNNIKVEFADGSAVGTFGVTGNLNIYGGTLTLGSSNTAGRAIFNLSGDFNFLGGTFDHTVANNTPSQLNFVKSNGTQLFNQNGGTWVFSSTRNMTINIGSSAANTNTTVQLQNNVVTASSGVDFVVNNTSILDMQGFTISGNTGVTTSDFTVISGGRLMTAFANGVSVANAYTAAVRSAGTRTFNNGALYTFNGSSAQTANLPTSTIGGLTVNNAAGVTQGSALTVTGAVVLTDGTLSMGTSNLTLGGSITRGAGAIDATNSLVTFNSASAQTVASASFLNNTTKNLTLNGAGGVTLQGNHTVSNALTLTAGNLSIGSNTLTLTGTMARNTGALNAGTGTVAFNGAAAQSVPSGLTTSAGYGTIIINNSNGVSFVGSPVVNDLLTLTAGTMTMGAATTLTLKGAISVGSGNIATDASVIFNGSTPQTIPASTFTSDAVKNLTINNSTGVSLGGNLSLTGALTLTTGKLVLGSNTLTVPAAGAPAGSATSYVQTNSTGVLKVTGVGTTANFPVGNASFNPLAVGNSDGLDWSVSVADAITNVASPQAPNVDKAVSRMWNITPSTNPTTTATSLTFGYNGTTDVGASFNNNIRVRVWHYESNNKWMAVSGYIMPATVSGLKSVSMSGQTTFSPFAISNFDAPLPVSLIRFTGKRTANSNELKWTTATEQNNRGFAIERSTDGITFQQVGFVVTRAAGGNSTSDLNYTYNESITAGTKWYYRLKQEDLDGRSKYSAVVLLKGDKSGILTVDGIYPNPVKGATSIRLQASA
ncbi:MAG: fibronectin type III domain-containing protein, partial [Chitinophagaceae bacterium]